MNKKIFYSVVLTTLLLLLSISFGIEFYAHKSKSEKNSYKTYVVKQGDTLWQIAKKTSPNEDPRKTCYKIQKVNNITTVIHPGQELIIPVE